VLIVIFNKFMLELKVKRGVVREGLKSVERIGAGNNRESLQHADMCILARNWPGLPGLERAT
jgi:hypothetical protein